MRYRSVFISDVHLGTRGSKAELLLAFFRDLECDSLFLVGDIFDGWRLSKGWFWPEEHSTVIQKVLRMARKGTRVVYLPGNHDEFMRKFLEHNFGSVELHDEIVYESLAGKKYVVVHGDKFDLVTVNAKWLAKIGDWAYTLLLNVNTVAHWVRSALDMPYWSLSKWAKHKVKEAVNFVGNYEQTLANYARMKRVDGVICGHIHSANISTIEGIEYKNCGDFVESCTALVEHVDGTWEIVHVGLDNSSSTY